METIPFSFAYAYVYVTPSLHSLCLCLCLCLCHSVNQALNIQDIHLQFLVIVICFDLLVLLTEWQKLPIAKLS